MEPSQSPWLFVTCPTYTITYTVFQYCLFQGLSHHRIAVDFEEGYFVNQDVFSTALGPVLARNSTACMFCFCSIWHVGQLSAEWANFWCGSEQFHGVECLSHLICFQLIDLADGFLGAIF